MHAKPSLSTLAQTTLFFLIPFLMGTAIDLYVPSLPAITTYFHTQQHLAQFTVSLYMLGYALGQFFLGIISDSTGRKKILLNGTALFVISSLFAVYAPNIFALIVYRFLQGVGMAGMGVMCRVIAVDCYRDLTLAKKLTFYSSSWAMGPIIGPVIGSYLQHYFDWQANFIYFTVFSLIIFNVVGPFLIQETLQYSVITYGHIALILGTGVFMGILLNRLILNYVNPMSTFSYGLATLIAICVLSLIAAYFFPINIYWVVVPVFLLLFFCGLILSNMVAKTIGFFPHLAGTTGAVYGLISAGGIFIITSLATILHTKSQKPLLSFYLLLFLYLLCFLPYSAK